jgi:cytoskeletal protein CcmA (bactofilin family)
VTLPGAVTLGTAGLQGYSAGVITFGATGTYEFGFGTYDGGATITIFDLNRALTNFNSADITTDDITATGFVSATGNVIGGNLRTAGSVSATGNVIGGNISSSGLITVTGNVTGGNINTAGLVSATGNVTGGNVIGRIRPLTGSATIAPVQFTSGTNLSVATAGVFEYDGVVFYGTPTASQRGVLAAEQFLVLVNPYTANDSNTAQKVFNSPTNGTVTLDAATTYFMEAVYYITRSVGSNSHTLSTLFALGGTLTSIAYTAETTSTAGNALGAVSRIYATGATGTVVTAASTATLENITVVLR